MTERSAAAHGMRTALLAGASGLAVGALLAGAAFEPFALVGNWGVVVGVVIGVVVFGAALRRLGRGTPARVVGGSIEATVLVAVAVGVGWWLVAWRIPPWALSGGWLWAVAAGAALMALRVVRGLRSAATRAGTAPGRPARGGTSPSPRSGPR